MGFLLWAINLLACVLILRRFFFPSGKVVSAALLQIFGREIAEVPLVATSLPHQGQVKSLYICTSVIMGRFC